MKAFENWEFEEIHRVFGYKRIYRNFSALEDWLKAEYPLTEFQNYQLETLRNNAELYVETWNEDELKFFLISPLVQQVGFGNEYYKPFTQRRLSAKIGDIEVAGVADFMIATGLQNPREPFFFIHEYKQERKRENDPLGQVLIEMLAAQAKNKNSQVLYGAYVVGRMWFFVALKGNEYAVSHAFDTAQNDIFQIFKMLLFVKEKIETVFLKIDH
ncbi:MAG: hypothetical protein MUE30_17440 [Spirosomaceae bacterium]|nr:hypothetical protein [Spirosomataceae bacterium]